jgi:hypothetical protein
VALLGLTFAGLPAQDAVLPAFRIRKAWVPNLRLFHFLAERRNAQDAYRDIEVEQVGLPFKQYPIFPDFTADYVIAAPTTFSFRAEADKHRFLQDVLRLLDQIPASATVLYKSHNGAARDYFSPPSYTAGARVTRRWPGVGKLVPAIAQRSPGGFRRHLDRLHTAILHTTLLDRVIPMSEASPDADMSLEAFLPHVTKGVIGGLSNTIWGTLYFGLPFYNCVDSLTRSQSKKELLVHKDPSNFLELNLQFFQVPYCRGNLGSGSYGRDIVKEEDRKGDLLSAILGELERPVLVSRLEESPAGVVR